MASTAWLEKELAAALGFSEVGDIAAYVTSSFSSKAEAAAYLEELLGLPPARAAQIGARLFPSASASTSASASASASAGIVARPVDHNSRLKAPRKNAAAAGSTAAKRSDRVANCLLCGRIEINGGRKCAFCGSALRYDASAATDVGYGPLPSRTVANAAARTGVAAGRVGRNPDLPKAAQELLDRAGRPQSRPRGRVGGAAAAADANERLAPCGRVRPDGALVLC